MASVATVGMTWTDRLMAARFRIIVAAGSVLGLAGAASAATIDWANITAILDGMATSFLPSLVGLVVAAVPVLIVLAVVGFTMKFLDKILDMLKFT